MLFWKIASNSSLFKSRWSRFRLPALDGVAVEPGQGGEVDSCRPQRPKRRTRSGCGAAQGRQDAPGGEQQTGEKLLGQEWGAGAGPAAGARASAACGWSGRRRSRPRQLRRAPSSARAPLAASGRRQSRRPRRQRLRPAAPEPAGGDGGSGGGRAGARFGQCAGRRVRPAGGRQCRRPRPPAPAAPEPTPEAGPLPPRRTRATRLRPRGASRLARCQKRSAAGASSFLLAAVPLRLTGVCAAGGAVLLKRIGAEKRHFSLL